MKIKLIEQLLVYPPIPNFNKTCLLFWKGKIQILCKEKINDFIHLFGHPWSWNIESRNNGESEWSSKESERTDKARKTEFGTGLGESGVRQRSCFVEGRSSSGPRLVEPRHIYDFNSWREVWGCYETLADKKCILLCVHWSLSRPFAACFTFETTESSCMTFDAAGLHRKYWGEFNLCSYRFSITPVLLEA
jgi:hypothetical protein